MESKKFKAYELQANYGYGDGWEYEISYTCPVENWKTAKRECQDRLKEYKANAPEFQYRIRVRYIN